MKKRKVTVLILAVLLVALLCVSLVACNKKKGIDSETRPLAMSIQTPDQVFNPFFSTSAYDSTIVGMTQIGMLSTGKDAGSDAAPYIVYGENEPTVVLDYWTDTVPNSNGGSNTKYSFVIKNGIKFSDGVDLTIKDVLFNLYVYLDPAYTGSSTIYSTDIVGLNAYRTQEKNADEQIADTFEQGFIQDAALRVQTLINYVMCFGQYNPPAGQTKPYGEGWQEHAFDADFFKNYKQYDEEGKLLVSTNLLEDYMTVKEQFAKELQNDWDDISIEDYKDMGFDQKWQVFAINDGGSDLYQKNADDSYVKDDKGNLVLDPARVQEYYEETLMFGLLCEDDENYYPDSDEQLRSDIAAFESEHAADLDELIEQFSIKSVFETYFPQSGTDNPYDAIKLTNATSFQQVLRYWMTADEILQKWTAEAKSTYFGQYSTLQVSNISGITVSKTNNYGGENYVLNIEINGVDPKAIYNFSFTVAPMHIYSNADEIKTFNTAWDEYWKDPEHNKLYGFGVKFSSSDFMQKTVNSSDNVKVPVGAGAYMACDASNNTDRASVLNGFFNNNIVHFVRNPYFETVGKGLNNAKIKYVRYKVVEADQIQNALITGDIDYGDPSAKPEYVTQLENAGLETVLTLTSGYGYVGINPRFVPNIVVRRAIMKAMNVQMTLDNYYGSLASVIKRPMSTTSWASPEFNGHEVGDYTSTGNYGPAVSYAYTDIQEGGYNEIRQMLLNDGYQEVDGVLQKEIKGYGIDKLDYKFTIAGGTTDHPAYAMFLNAQRILNASGFAVRVVNSNNALTDLSAGKLAVWAAAWSSTIDPDMYQVYHMQSNASSVNNWGYKQILANTQTYDKEYNIITQLSNVIDEARETLDKDTRTEKYATALNWVMELAVEFPTYQRRDLAAYNSKVIDKKTLPAENECGPYYGLLSRIWEVDYVK